jgi:hypothetical protein
MPSWKKVITSGSDASLASLFVANAVTSSIFSGSRYIGASFTGSFSGSVAAPGSNTNIIYNSSGVLAGSTNFIFDGTNVGIGTTAPSSNLDIRGASDTAGQISLQLRSGNTSTNFSSSQITFGYANTALYRHAIKTRHNAGSAPGNSMDFYTWRAGVDGTSTIGTQHVMSIDGASVGIGTTTPAHKLDISGSIRIPNSNYLYINSVGGTAAQILTVDTGDNTILNTPASGDIYLRSNGTTIARIINNGDVNLGGTSATSSPIVKITTAGNVGIGSTSPTSKLQVIVPEQASGVGGLTIVGNTNSKVVSIGANATYGYIQSHGTVPLYINELGNNVIINPSGGSVGIGTTSPTYKLDVEGTINGELKAASFVNSNTGTSAYSEINVIANDSTLRIGVTNTLYPGAQWAGGGMFMLTPGNMSFGPGNDYKMFISASGNVGIGTLTPTLAKLQVNGNVHATSFTGSFSGSITSPGSNTQVIYNNAGVLAGSSNFIFDGSNVGIGTTSPIDKLHVEGNSSTPGIYTTISNLYNGIGNRAGIKLINLYGGVAYSASIYADWTGQGLIFQANRDLIASQGGFEFHSAAGVAQVVIRTNSGNVGIGTTAPTQKLEVQGVTQIGNDNVNISSLIFARKNVFQARANYYIPSADSPTHTWIEGGIMTAENAGTSFAGLRPYYEVMVPAAGSKSFGFVNAASGSSFTSTALTSSLVMDYTGLIYMAHNGGNVGIGTTTPSAKLQVAFPANTTSHVFKSQAGDNLLALQTFPTTNRMQLLVGDYNGLSAPNIAAISDTNTGIQWAGSDVLKFVNNGSENVTISAVGNVGIGTTSPTAKLHVSGNTYIDGRASIATTSTAGTGLTVGGSSVFLSFGEFQQGNALYFYSSGNTFNTALAQSGNLFAIGSSVYVSSSNNVGIGTSTLENIASTTTLTINGSTGGGATSYQVGGVRVGLANGNDNYFTLQSYNSRPLSLGYNNNNTVVINTSNNVGIGTTSPISKLTLSGNMVINGTGTSGGTPDGSYRSIYSKTLPSANGGGIILESNSTTQSPNLSIYITGSSNNIFNGGIQMYYEPSRTYFKQYNTAGAAGNASGSIYFFQLDNRSAKLAVSNDGTVTDSSIYAKAIWDGGSAGVFRASSVTQTAKIFSVESSAGSDYLLVGSTGNVGIGTTNPTALLTVDSSEPRIRLNRLGTNHIIINHDGTTGTIRNESNTPLQIGTNGAAVMTITGSNVGIGSVSPAYPLDVNGTVRVTTLIETSTKILKENIQPYSTDINKFKKLKPVSFNWKDTKKEDIGLIAEDLNKVFPEFVSKDNGKPVGIHYGKLAAIFINVIKEQQERIEALEKQVKKLIK